MIRRQRQTILNYFVSENRFTKIYLALRPSQLVLLQHNAVVGWELNLVGRRGNTAIGSLSESKSWLKLLELQKSH